jgi:DNA-binding Xre family transcriptional regulator
MTEPARVLSVADSATGEHRRVSGSTQHRCCVLIGFVVERAMIANERQYRIAGAQIRRFEEALAAQAASEPGGDIAPRIVQATGDAIASERDELRAQLARYEDLRSGRVAQRGLCSLRGLSVALIEGRIAARMTQRDLAKRLGIPEQQVQRWEATGYIGVALERLQEIADALGLQMCGTVSYDVPDRSAGTGRDREPGAPGRG